MLLHTLYIRITLEYVKRYKCLDPIHGDVVFVDGIQALAIALIKKHTTTATTAKNPR